MDVLALQLFRFVGVADKARIPPLEQVDFQLQHKAGKVGVGDVRHNNAHHAGAAGAQALGAHVGHIFVFADDAPHARLCLFGKAAVLVDHA